MLNMTKHGNALIYEPHYSEPERVSHYNSTRLTVVHTV